MSWIDILDNCAPLVSPITMQKIVKIESGGDALALNVNGLRVRLKPKTSAEAAAIARQYIAQGHTVDLGLMQINSTNVARLGYSVEDMFVPCKNLKAGSELLSKSYLRARKSRAPQLALRAALSAYNTGNFVRGFQNGYVAKYFRNSTKYFRSSGSSRVKSNYIEKSYVVTKQRPVYAYKNPYTAETIVYSRFFKKG